MKHVAPILAFTLVATATFAASARAEGSEEPSVPPMRAPEVDAPSAAPQPAEGGSPLWSSTRRWAPTLKRPTSVRGFDEARAELVERLEHAGDEEERAEIREDLKTLKAWLDEDTERADPNAFVGGVVLLSVGGAAAVGGGFCLLGGVYGGLNDRTGATCGAALGVGLGVAAIGLAVFLTGKPLVMKRVSQPTASSALGPSTRLLVGPGSIGLGGTF